MIIFSYIVTLVWGLKCKMTVPLFVHFLELVKVFSQLPNATLLPRQHRCHVGSPDIRTTIALTLPFRL